MAAPSKAFTLIADSAIDPDSPETTGLITQFRDNDVHLEEWLGKNFVAAIDHDHDGVNSKKVSGANLVLIERKELSADATSVDFTGLAGETDEAYLLMGKIVRTVGGGPFSVFFSPNALSTNQTSIVINSDGSTVTTGSSTRMVLGTQPASGTEFSFLAYFWARRTIQTVSSVRHLLSFSRRSGQTQINFGEWNETVTDLTSIRIESGPNALGKGSSIALFKILQT